MPVVRRKSVAVKALRAGVPLAGSINGSNTTFAFPEPALVGPSYGPSVFYNGQQLLRVDDYALTESGGPGSGFDTVSLLFAPKPGDKLTADYVAA